MDPVKVSDAGQRRNVDLNLTGDKYRSLSGKFTAFTFYPNHRGAPLRDGMHRVVGWIQMQTCIQEVFQKQEIQSTLVSNMSMESAFRNIHSFCRMCVILVRVVVDLRNTGLKMDGVHHAHTRKCLEANSH